MSCKPLSIFKAFFKAICALSLFWSAAHAKTPTAQEYTKLSACEKQDILWKNITETKHAKLPAYSKLGILEVFGLARQALIKKLTEQSDFAPKGWMKYIHKRGAIAKVRFNSIGDHPYTGVFKGSECSLLRLSLTYKPVASKDLRVRDHSRPGPRYKEIETKGKPVAPGLAIKMLRDGVPSANVSALYTLQGQGQNYNFFSNPLSNIVPQGDSLGEKIVHRIFSTVSKYPEELKMQSMANMTSKGEKVKDSKYPKQIFFVPNKELKFDQDFHDVREDFARIEKGTLLYKVYALKDSDKYKSFSNYKISDIPKHLEDSVLIGEVVATSSFIASEFGDTGIFFKHDAE